MSRPKRGDASWRRFAEALADVTVMGDLDSFPGHPIFLLTIIGIRILTEQKSIAK